MENMCTRHHHQVTAMSIYGIQCYTVLLYYLVQSITIQMQLYYTVRSITLYNNTIYYTLYISTAQYKLYYTLYNLNYIIDIIQYTVL